MGLSIHDVLNFPQLQQMRLRAGHDDIYKAIRWIYVAENENIFEWLKGGELVFITGINHQRNEKNLLELVYQGYQKNIAGLVILTGEECIHFIPASVIAYANELNVPIVEQPYSLKMIEVTHIIGTALVELEQTQNSIADTFSRLIFANYSSEETIAIRAKNLNLNLQVSYLLVSIKMAAHDELFISDQYLDPEKKLRDKKQFLIEQLDAWANEEQLNFPVLKFGDVFVLALPLRHEDIETWIGKMNHLILQLAEKTKPLKLYIGLSNIVQSVASFQRGFDEATQAQKLAIDLHLEHRCLPYNDLGILRLISAIPDKSVPRQFMQETLGCFFTAGKRQADIYLNTLDALVQENFNVMNTAVRLGIHRNTITQRMQKIEALTGYSLEDPKYRLHLSVSLIIWQLFSPTPLY
ncbi:PucR family transcriptional regulator [Acinetobacter populi]|uniref:PucR family transcriptional regulator n=1 Tax=Acinetobacter populi TaxID=1582270 RepID=A0A1Z9YWM3_9GAMM|nr:PucR family transcriptional regulator [Acinetobacter populi]OUY06600.1 hypothetical protein CAP51_11760 [Acinetobacter populi]